MENNNPQIKYCSQCGKPNRYDAKFCHFCGHNLDLDNVDENNNQSAENTKNEEPEMVKIIKEIPKIEGLEIKRFDLYKENDKENDAEKTFESEAELIPEEAKKIQDTDENKKFYMIYLIISSIIILILLLIGESISLYLLSKTDPEYIRKVEEMEHNQETARQQMQEIINQYESGNNGSLQSLIAELERFTGVRNKWGLIRITLLPLLITSIILLLGGMIYIKIARGKKNIIYAGICGALSMGILVLAQGNLIVLLFGVPFGFMFSALGAIIIGKAGKKR